MNKETQIEMMAAKIIKEKDMETLMWFLHKMDSYHYQLYCTCMKPKVGELTCISCDDED